MRISFQTYRTIKRTLAHALHTRRESHQEQHLNTLALLICGIVGANHVQFAQVADHVPIRGRKNESVITRFRRWVKHDAVTPEAWYGPVMLIGVWDAAYAEPLYLITSLTDADAAVERYRLRFRIECMFANHKSRGFHLQKSHLAAPERLARLLIATSLAYLWVQTVAIFARAQNWLAQFHRTDRCDLSAFQIGIRALHYAQREHKRVPVQFHLPVTPG